MTEAAFAYAGARMQARHGERPAEATWSQLARIGDFARLVQAVRATSLAPWVADLEGGSGSHRIEAHLRERFRHEVEEVARWLPGRWRPAARWFAWIPDLPSVAHVRFGRAPHAWMWDDPVGRALAGSARGHAPGLPPDLVAIARAPDDGRPVAAHWLDAWRARWPGRAGTRADALERAYGQVRHLLRERGLRARDEGGGRELRRLFRRHGRAPAGAFAYLALLYVQFLRLRGILLQRELFGAPA